MYSSKLKAACRFSSFILLLTSFLLSTISATGYKSLSPDTEAAANQFVKQRLQIWQERLSLKGWDVHVELVPSASLEPRTLGNIRWDTVQKTATISVLTSKEYRLPYRAMLDDMELTIVHELVHLELASLPRDDASRNNEERAVSEISRALLKLAR